MTITTADNSKQGYFSNGEIRLEGSFIVSTSAALDPKCIIAHKPVSVGDKVTYNPFAAVRDGDSTIGSYTLDSNGVPTITGSYGMYGLTFKYNGGADETEYVGHANDSTVEALFNLPSQDSEGYSVLTPSSDSRLVYVDATSGNDATAGPAGNSTDHYVLSTLPTPSDWESPGAVNAYQTVNAAKAELRSGYPDWLILKRGETFSVSNTIYPVAGRSATERCVFNAYSTGNRPLVKPTAATCIDFNSNAGYNAVVGWNIYPTQRDPGHGDWVGWASETDITGIKLYGGATALSDILIEDCHIEYTTIAINVASYKTDTLAVRKNILGYSYSQNAHSQGMFATQAQVYIDSNIFDHSGWYKQSVLGDNDKSEGQATIYNHNIYLEEPRNSIIKNNIFTRPSSNGVKITSNPADATEELAGELVWDMYIYDNVFVDCEIGINQYGNNDWGVASRYRDFCVFGNSFYKLGDSQQTKRTLAWSSFMDDVNGGFYGGNYHLHTGDATVNNVIGPAIEGFASDVVVSRNVVYEFGETGGSIAALEAMLRATSSNFTNVSVIGNYLQATTKTMGCIGNIDSTTGITFSDNKYSTNLTGTNWFYVDDVVEDATDWATATGETGHSTSAVTFQDATRTIETYQTSLAETATVQGFVDSCRAQKRGAWDTNHEAIYVNRYFKNGYRE